FDNLFSTLYALVQAIEARDPYTRQHSDRVARLSLSIAGEMGCSKEDMDIINFAGRLHDIGKIGVMDKVLLKPGKLTDEEFDMIKKHPVIGANIIGQLGMWDREREIIKYHHERFDGTGYPEELKGDRIPFLARILAVADAFDAMDSDRAYRKKMEPERIMEIINEAAGTQFDPDVVKVFQKLYKQGKIQQTKKE
ncbi:MAG: HD-GYP domain-containing protein, partial [Desulfosarcina sp.]|nr:HD-GYP domain-containing protein [Desulfobacterales bacterium]